MFKKLFNSLFGGKSVPEPEPVVDVPNFHERRKGIRRPCRFSVEGWLGREQFEATVIDMSGGGLLFTCPPETDLKPGLKVELTYPEFLQNVELDTVEFKVVWTRVRESESLLYVGVTMADPSKASKSWFKAKMKAVGFRGHNLREQRKVCRVKCELPATLVLMSAEMPCVIRNIGLGGLLLEMKKPVRVGSQLEIRIEDHPTLSTWTLEAMVRHFYHPDPDSPFLHGFLFRGLTSEQEHAVQEFMIEQREKIWQSAPVTSFVDASAEDAEEPETWDEDELLSDAEFEREKAAVLKEIEAEEAREAEELAKAAQEDLPEPVEEEPTVVVDPDDDDVFVPKYKTAEEALAALERGEIEVPGPEASEEVLTENKETSPADVSGPEPEQPENTEEPGETEEPEEPEQPENTEQPGETEVPEETEVRKEEESVVVEAPDQDRNDPA